MEKYQGISILYEDNHLLVVIKPCNMPVCLDESNDKDLLSTLKTYLKEKYNKPGNVYLGLVHRLDRPVMGIMVFAKTSKAAGRLTKQINDKNFKKTYYAVIEGIPSKKGTFTDYMLKDEKKHMSFVGDNKQGKLAILNYELIKSVDNLSLVKIDLVTGRHHQIRVQFASRGYPLYGDHKYNKNFINDKNTDISLVAKELVFKHPITNQELKFEINLPKKYPYSLF